MLCNKRLLTDQPALHTSLMHDSAANGPALVHWRDIWCSVTGVPRLAWDFRDETLGASPWRSDWWAGSGERACRLDVDKRTGTRAGVLLWNLLSPAGQGAKALQRPGPSRVL